MLSFSLAAIRRRWKVILAIGLAATACLQAWRWLPSGEQSVAVRGGIAQQPVPVSVAVVEQGALRTELHAVGTVTSLAQVSLRSQIDGELVRVLFAEGQRVEQGQLLAEIDARPYRLRLAGTEGEARRIRASWENAAADLRRYEALARQDAIAGQRLDQARARVRDYAAQWHTAQASVDEARLQLGYTRINAPLAGRVGLRHVDAGNQVRADEPQGLAVLVQTAPISVLFTIAETRLALLQQALAKAGVAGLRVQAWDADNRHVLAEGTLQSMDNRIDNENGTLRLRAYFANEGEALFPNQFVNIRIMLTRVDNGLIIPASAVQYGRDGAFAYVIDGDSRAERRELVLGPAGAGRVAVVQGLLSSERVVLEGIDRLEDGSHVLVVEQQT